MLSRVARGHSYAEVADGMNLGLRTVAGDATKAEGLTGSTNKGELIRWWQDHERAWARWWLDQLGIDPQDLIA